MEERRINFTDFTKDYEKYGSEKSLIPSAILKIVFDLLISKAKSGNVDNLFKAIDR